MPQTALITGAYRGLGFETARQLAAKGFTVITTARKKSEGEKAADKLRLAGGNVQFVEMDVTSEPSIQTAVKAVSAIVDHLDVLINNAGVYPDGDRTILTIDRETILKTYETNTVGPILVTRAFLPLLEMGKTPHVINISSGLGALSSMAGAAPSYSISKAALNAVTRQFAAVLTEKGIAVNSVCPGWVRTEMGGQNAPRSVEDGVDTIVWLASERPKNINGQFLRDRQVIAW
jgi:NAD(P)-dependent dehydrogenase (short-subunit alcohol dehydrogenase family)